jgi:hypothetical protein
MTIGKLNVLLGLNNAQFATGMHSSGNHVRKFRADIESSTSVITRLQSGLRTTATIAAAAGVAAAGAAYAGFRILRNEMEKIDAIGKKAQTIGIDPGQLVGLRHAAELSGVATDKLESSLVRLTRRLGEAAHGGGEAFDALRELRLNAAELASVAPDVALYRIADAMMGVGSQTERVRIAYSLFGREGIDVVRMLADGSAGLRAMQEDAERLGLTFSKFDHAQIAAANDAMTRLGQSTGVLKRTLAIELAPVLTVVANQMTEWFSTGGRQAAGFSSELGGIAAAAGGIVGAFQSIAIHWTSLQAVLLRVAAEVTDALAALPCIARRIIVPGWMDVPDTETLKTAAAGLHGAFVEFNQRVTELEKADWVASFADRIKTMRDEIQAGLNAGKPTTDLADLDALNEQMRAMEELRRRGEQMEAALRTPQEALEARILDANRMVEMGAIGWQTYTREIAAARREFEDATRIFSGNEIPGTATAIERGTQADFESQMRWEAMSREATRPLPGADLVVDERTFKIGELEKQLEEQRRAARDEITQWMRDNPLPTMPTPAAAGGPQLADDVRQSVGFDVAPFPEINPEPVTVPVDFASTPRLRQLENQMEELRRRARADISDWIQANPLPTMPTPAAGTPQLADDVRQTGNFDVAPTVVTRVEETREPPRNITRVTPVPVAGDNQAVVTELKEVNKRLAAIEAENARGTNAANRTASAAERIQLPEVVEM